MAKISTTTSDKRSETVLMGSSLFVGGGRRVCSWGKWNFVGRRVYAKETRLADLQTVGLDYKSFEIRFLKLQKFGNIGR